MSICMLKKLTNGLPPTDDFIKGTKKKCGGQDHATQEKNFLKSRIKRR